MASSVKQVIPNSAIRTTDCLTKPHPSYSAERKRGQPSADNVRVRAQPAGDRAPPAAEQRARVQSADAAPARAGPPVDAAGV